MIQLLKQLSDVYVPFSNEEIVESVFFGGRFIKKHIFHTNIRGPLKAESSKLT